MKKRIVIIGGGFAGSLIARKLQNHYKVALIDLKDYFEFTPSVLRTIVEPQHIKKIQVLHNKYLQKTVVIRDTATDISNEQVITATHKFAYDYLIVCTGSTYKFPIKGGNVIIATRAQKIVMYAQKLNKSLSILIIGGGLVGVELAAEIIEKYPSKKVTVVHAGKELIERNPKIARSYAYKFLKKRRVNIVMDEMVIKKQGKFYITHKGRQISADLAFICTGIAPNSKHLERFFRLSLNQKGFLNVNKSLQVQGFRNIFAAGDVTSILEEKTAQNAEKHAKIIVKNIEALELNHLMKEYKPKSRPMVISLGKRDGIFIYRKMVMTGMIPAFIKWFIEWKTMIIKKFY